MVTKAAKPKPKKVPRKRPARRSGPVKAVRTRALPKPRVRKAKGKKLGRPKFAPTVAQRYQVECMAARGIPHENIAALVRKKDNGKMGIALDTLHKYFERELQIGRSAANDKVAGNLHLIATAFPPLKGTVTAAIAWMNNFGGWSHKHVLEGNPDKPVEHKHTIIKDDQVIAGILKVLVDVGVIPEPEDQG